MTGSGALHSNMLTRLTQLPRRYSSQKSFYNRVIENIRNEWSQNKEIKQNLEKFRQETEKLEQTDALKQAREKFKKVEEDTFKDVNDALQNAKDTIKKADIIQKTMKTISSTTKTISSTTKVAAEGISNQPAFRRVEQEISEVEMISRIYKAPEELLKRSERDNQKVREVEPNEKEQSVELHKDSKFASSWNAFKEENPYINKLFELKMKYDESDSPLVRLTKNLTDRISDMFQRSDLSVVLTEICKVDQEFDLNAFLKDCEKFIIPTILESISQSRLDILADWCHEAVYNVLSKPLSDAKKLGLRISSNVVDLQNLELAMGKMMEQGPVLVLTFNAQQVSYVTDSKGNVVEGDPDKVVLNTYVMAFCRDQGDFNPKTAWRLIDVAMQQSQLSF